MDLSINISKILVVINDKGTDRVYIYTMYPAPFPVEVTEGQPLIMSFEAQRGKGVQYVRDTFGVEPELLDLHEMMKEVK